MVNQALGPGCRIPIAKGQRLVLAGDHHQRPPTVKREKAARETLFEKCIRRQPHTARMLKLQYRMHTQIMGFSSHQFMAANCCRTKACAMPTWPRTTCAFMTRAFMTRARRKLLLVGDSSTLCRHPFFRELLAYVKGVRGLPHGA